MIIKDKRVDMGTLSPKAPKFGFKMLNNTITTM